MTVIFFSHILLEDTINQSLISSMDKHSLLPRIMDMLLMINRFLLIGDHCSLMPMTEQMKYIGLFLFFVIHNVNDLCSYVCLACFLKISMCQMQHAKKVGHVWDTCSPGLEDFAVEQYGYCSLLAPLKRNFLGTFWRKFRGPTCKPAKADVPSSLNNCNFLLDA